MRKIEERIIDAIDNRRTVRLSMRDRVTVDDETRDVYVYLWDTCIASIGEDSVSIGSGGFRTVTTKSRLNAILRHYCDAALYQEDGKWKVVFGLTRSGNMNDKSTIRPFADGMTIPRRR